MKFGKTDEQKRIEGCGENFAKRGFAWLPRKLGSGQWIFLEKYYSVRYRRVWISSTSEVFTYRGGIGDDHLAQDVEDVKNLIKGYTALVGYTLDEQNILSAFLDKKIQQFEESIK